MLLLTKMRGVFQADVWRQSRLQVPPWLLTLSYIVAGIIGGAGVIFALVQLISPTLPLQVQRTWLDRTPVTIYTAPQGEQAPVIVLVHEYAGSQQTLIPFAVTLARNGYTAITFDLPGHGRSSFPLPKDGGDRQIQMRELNAVLNKVVAFARQHPRSNGQVGLLGHAMGADTAVIYAQTQDTIPTMQIGAVVALSKNYPGVTPLSPRNLLVVNGALEFWLWDTTRLVTSQTGVRLGETAGNFQQGTARRVEIVPWVEHIGVLFNPATIVAVQDWFDQSFQRPPAEETFYLRGRGMAVMLLYLSAVLLFWPFSLLLKPVTRPDDPVTPATPFKQKWWFGLALLPVVITPLLVRVLPGSGWIDSLVGGALLFHFAIYGMLTAVGIVIYRLVHKENIDVRWPGLSFWRAALIMTAFVVGYVFIVMGIPEQFFVFNYFPPLARIIALPLAFLAMLVYFLADEWLTQSPGAPLGSYAITKLFFLLSLTIEGILRGDTFYMIVLAPVLALYFVVFGLFARRIHQRTRTIVVASLANALIFAWIVTAIMPLVA